MKKTITPLIVVLFMLGIPLISAQPVLQQSPLTRLQQINIENPDDIEWTGNFTGVIGVGTKDNFTTLGYMAGQYKIRNFRANLFSGRWINENQTNNGTIRGIFGRHLLLGIISSEAWERDLPIIGFLGSNETHFIGRFMSFIGPAMYFGGTYCEYNS